MSELDIQGILAALVEEGVDFLLIGGTAVGFHGFVRGTKDVDVVPAPNSENLTRLSRVLTALDAQVVFADCDRGGSWWLDHQGREL